MNRYTKLTGTVGSVGFLIKSKTYSKLSSFSFKMFATPLLFHSIKSIFNVLNDEKFKEDEGVKELLKKYEEIEQRSKSENYEKKFPLIVVEGLDGSGKTTITRVLSAKIGAHLYSTPPPVFGEGMRIMFDSNRLLRTAFYALGNYVAAMEMLKMLDKQPVVLDRFWHSTAAYALAQAIENHPELKHIPSEEEDIYNWPQDLLKPDIVLLLAVSEEVRLKRHSNRTNVTEQEKLLKSNDIFRENVLTAYKNMKNPEVNFVNGDPTVKEVVQDLYDKIKHLL